MQKLVEDNIINLMCDSADDVIQNALPIANAINPNVHASMLGDGGRGWLGTTSVEDAFNKLRNGWPEMLEVLRTMLKEMTDVPELAPSVARLRRRKRHRTDYGDTLDIHRVWSGELDKAWERPTSIERICATQRHVTIFVDVAVHCNINHYDAMWRGAAAMLICDRLQEAGRSVEIVIGGDVFRPVVTGQTVRYGIKVKDYTTPLHEEVLAALVTATCFRTYGFIMLSATGERTVYGLGQPYGEGFPKQVQDRADAGEKIVRIGRCFNKQEAMAVVMQALDSLKQANGHAA